MISNLIFHQKFQKKKLSDTKTQIFHIGHNQGIGNIVALIPIVIDKTNLNMLKI